MENERKPGQDQQSDDKEKQRREQQQRREPGNEQKIEKKAPGQNESDEGNRDQERKRA